MRCFTCSLWMPLRSLASACVLLLCVMAQPALAQWRAGVASVAITPDTPVRMAGYASRTTPFTGVDRDLFAKALVLEDAAGTRVALVTTDLLGVRKAIVDAVVAALPREAGLTDRARIIIGASHTHAGPALSLDPTPVAGVSAAEAEATAAYTRRLVESLAALVTRAAAQLEPATLSWGTGIAHFAMNRREFTPTGVTLGVNPRGPVDRSVPVLRVAGADGRPRAVVFGYACHNTTLTGDNYRLSGDYAGFAQAEIEQRVPGVQAMFLAGTGADANPYPRGTLADARRHGETLGQEVVRVLNTTLQEVSGPLRAGFDEVALPLQQPSRAELEARAVTGSGTDRTVARHMLSQLDSGSGIRADYAAPLAVWQFGASLTLVALSGEVVVDYVYAIEKALGPLRLWVAAYANDYFGYLASPRVLEEGGYETRGLFTNDGWFSPDASLALVGRARSLAGTLGRTLPATTDAPRSADAAGARLRPIEVDAATGTARAVVVEAGALVHTALMQPVDADGRVQGAGDPDAQAAYVLENLKAALAAAGASIDRMARLHVYVADASVVPAVNRVLAGLRSRGASPPALTVVESRMARPGVQMAMDAVAVTTRAVAATGERRTVRGLAPMPGGGAHVAVQPAGPFAMASGRAAPGDLPTAVRGTMAQLRADLEGIGLGLGHAVQVKTFLRDMSRASEVQQLVAEAFEGTAPPQVVTEWRDASLPVEIELVAAAPAGHTTGERVTFVEPISSRFSRVARVAAGQPVFVSGLTGTAADPAAQVREIFQELSRLLDQAGSDMRHLVKSTYYVSDAAADAAINTIRPSIYDEARPPAASKISVQGTGRPGTGAVIDMIAVTTGR